jgi:serine-type D-Ala-D-Ala endopeptidase (penicillin-binding protein 7)
MSVFVVLDMNVNMSDSVTVTMSDITGAGHSHIRAGNRVSRINLFRCALVASDNAAVRALARSTGLPESEFARRMNQRARDLGMKQTTYVEPTGLDENNKSTAADQAILLREASKVPIIVETTSLPTYSFPCGRRIETLTNTNRLLKSRSDIVSGKTGFTRPAGYCLATTIGQPYDPQLAMVVLGAASNAGRFAESAKLINWALGSVPAAESVEPGSSLNRKR